MARQTENASVKYDLKLKGNIILPGESREINFDTLTVKEADALAKKHPRYFVLKPKPTAKKKEDKK